MRFFHVVPRLRYGAGDCQCIFDVHNIFMDMQFSSEIYGAEIDPRLGRCAAYPYRQIEHNITSDDVVIYYHQKDAAADGILQFLQEQKDFVHMWVVLYLMDDEVTADLLKFQEIFACCLVDSQPGSFRHDGSIKCPVYCIAAEERRSRLPVIQSYLYDNIYPDSLPVSSSPPANETEPMAVDGPACRDETAGGPEQGTARQEMPGTGDGTGIPLRSRFRNWLAERLPASIMRNLFPARELTELNERITYEVADRIRQEGDQIRQEGDQIWQSLERKIEGLARQLHANTPYTLPPVNIYDYHHHLPMAHKNIFVDVTGITRIDLGTGIQRVVNNLYLHLARHGDVVAFRDGAAFGQKKFNFITPSYSMETSYTYTGRFQSMNAVQSDKLLGHNMDNSIIFLLDSSWEHAPHLTYLLSYAVEHNSHIYALVHDLIPFQHPELLDSNKLRQVFTEWHNMILEKADGIICVSRTTADAVAEYYQEMRFVRRRPMNIFYFHPGADIPALERYARDSIREFVAAKPTFLMVGTVEPRKGHRMVLEAFRELIHDLDIQLLILGHDGWHNDEFKQLLEENPELAAHVMWVKDADDRELQWAYSHTEALIAASIAEGFGLPLIEAASFNLPVICSDIPIFHEVLQEQAVFFPVMDREAFISCIRQWLAADRKQLPAARLRPATWHEAADEVRKILEQQAIPYKILN